MNSINLDALLALTDARGFIDCVCVAKYGHTHYQLGERTHRNLHTYKYIRDLHLYCISHLPV